MNPREADIAAAALSRLAETQRVDLEPHVLAAYVEALFPYHLTDALVAIRTVERSALRMPKIAEVIAAVVSIIEDRRARTRALPPPASSPDELCTEPGCGAAVQEHIDQFRAFLARTVSVPAAQPSGSERRGLHPFRPAAIIWCKDNPDEARALPAWAPGILASIGLWQPSP